MVHGDGRLRCQLDSKDRGSQPNVTVSRSEVAISAKRCCYHLEMVERAESDVVVAAAGDGPQSDLAPHPIPIPSHSLPLSSRHMNHPQHTGTRRVTVIDRDAPFQRIALLEMRMVVG
jgi:hypothetical protein